MKAGDVGKPLNTVTSVDTTKGESMKGKIIKGALIGAVIIVMLVFGPRIPFVGKHLA